MFSGRRNFVCQSDAGGRTNVKILFIREQQKTKPLFQSGKKGAKRTARSAGINLVINAESIENKDV
jgi:hypothetical protein